MPKKILSKIYHRLLISYLSFKKLKSSLGHKKLKNRLYIYIPDASLARYLYLYSFFLQTKFTVYLFPDFRMLRNLPDYSHWILQEPNIRFKKRQIKRNSGIVKYMDSEYRFKISYDYFNEIELLDNKKFIMPYTMHPGQYKWRYRDKIKVDLCATRPLKVMFLGGANQENYHNSIIKQKFNLYSRWETVQFLEKNVNHIKPEDDKHIHELIEDNTQDLIIYNTYDTVLWQKEWLYTLSNLDFYIALPGVAMPLSHNLIEAMSVGAIPILQYNQYIYPKLEHKINCLVYNTLSELAFLITDIQAMSKAEILELRQNSYNYYLRYHSTQGFSENFEKFLESQDHSDGFSLVLNAEVISTELYGV